MERRCLSTIGLGCAVLLVSAAVVADEGTVAGSLTFTDAEGEVTEFALDTGVALESDPFQGGERIKVVLVAEPFDRQAYLEAVAETGSHSLGLFQLQIDRRIEFDVCRFDDDTPTEICGVHVNGPGINSSHSGLGGFYGHFTEAVGFEDGRVSAELATTEPEEGVFDSTFSFEVTFDLPIVPTAD